MRDKLQIVHGVFYLNIIYLFFNNLISRFLTWSSGTNELVFRVEPPPWVTTKNNIYYNIKLAYISITKNIQKIYQVQKIVHLD